MTKITVRLPTPVNLGDLVREHGYKPTGQIGLPSRKRPPPPNTPEEAIAMWPYRRWDHNDRAYTKRNAGLYSHAPKLRRRARKQARRMRSAFRSDDWHGAGYHAGRLMALRLEAYDNRAEERGRNG